MKLRRFTSKRANFVLNPQPGNMFRTPGRWDTIMLWGRNPQHKENTYGWIILKTLEDGPKTYTELLKAIEAELYNNPVQWLRFYKRQLAEVIRSIPYYEEHHDRFIRELQEAKDAGDEHRVQIREWDVARGAYLKRTLVFIQDSLKLPLTELLSPWENGWEMPTMNPAYGQLLAIMEAQGKIKRIKRGIYSL